MAGRCILALLLPSMPPSRIKSGDLHRVGKQCLLVSVFYILKQNHRPRSKMKRPTQIRNILQIKPKPPQTRTWSLPHSSWKKKKKKEFKIIAL